MPPSNRSRMELVGSPFATFNSNPVANLRTAASLLASASAPGPPTITVCVVTWKKPSETSTFIGFGMIVFHEPARRLVESAISSPETKPQETILRVCTAEASYDHCTRATPIE